MKKAEIFKKAHQVAKIKKQADETYRAAFGKALKYVHLLIKQGKTELLECEHEIKELDKAIENTNDLKNREYLMDQRRNFINKVNEIKFNTLLNDINEVACHGGY